MPVELLASVLEERSLGGRVALRDLPLINLSRSPCLSILFLISSNSSDDRSTASLIASDLLLALAAMSPALSFVFLRMRALLLSADCKRICMSSIGSMDSDPLHSDRPRVLRLNGSNKGSVHRVRVGTTLGRCPLFPSERLLLSYPVTYLRPAMTGGLKSTSWSVSPSVTSPSTLRLRFTPPPSPLPDAVLCACS